MFGNLFEIRDTLRGVVAGFEPGCHSGPDAARLVEVFAEVENLAAAGKVLAARRVRRSGLDHGDQPAKQHVRGTSLQPPRCGY